MWPDFGTIALYVCWRHHVVCRPQYCRRTWCLAFEKLMLFFVLILNFNYCLYTAGHQNLTDLNYFIDMQKVWKLLKQGISMRGKVFVCVLLSICTGCVLWSGFGVQLCLISIRPTCGESRRKALQYSYPTTQPPSLDCCTTRVRRVTLLATTLLI